MASYLPISAEVHIARGYCCFESRGNHSRCVFCPWHEKAEPPKFTPDPRILDALLSGETTTIYSEMRSLVPSVTLCDRVTIIYKSYQIMNDTNEELQSDVGYFQRNPTIKDLFEALNERIDLCSKSELIQSIKLIDEVQNLNGAEIDTLSTLYNDGPLQDGNVPAKSGRDGLCEKRMAERVIVKSCEGYNACTQKGFWAMRILKALGKI